MPAGHLGPEEVVTVSPDATVADAVEKFEDEMVGSVVVAEDDEPVGMLTDRDVALAVTDADDVESEPVESLMTEDPVTIEEDADAMAVPRTLGEHDVRRAPIVDDEGELAGMASLDDLVATIGEQLDHVSETIEVQSPDYSP